MHFDHIEANAAYIIIIFSLI